jgi:hypothetical protein
MRSFFTDGRVFDLSKTMMVNKDYRLDSRTWDQTMTDLEHLKTAWELMHTIENAEFQNWRYILQSFQNDIWIFPVLTFIYTRMESDGVLSDSNIMECCLFMRNIVRYLYSKGFDNSSVSGKSIYDEMFQATVCAAKNMKYCPEIQLNDGFREKLNSAIVVSRFRRGFCAILEHLNQCDMIRNKELDDFQHVFNQAAVEHILPQKWDDNYYDQWNADNTKSILNTLGNLCLLETTRNIKASNLFFSQKKSQAYTRSGYTTVRTLCLLKDWDYETYSKRHVDCVQKLIRFLEGSL